MQFQTEASLSNLQKSIHPLAMSKLKGLLDLQEEIVNYKTEEAYEERFHEKSEPPGKYASTKKHEL